MEGAVMLKASTSCNRLRQDVYSLPSLGHEPPSVAERYGAVMLESSISCNKYAMKGLHSQAWGVSG